MDKRKRIVELGLRYRRMGFNALPASTTAKHPSGFSWKGYREKPPCDAEFEYLCGFGSIRDLGLCFLTGRHSGNVVVIDVDSDYLAFTYFYDLFDRTLVCRTKHGFHFYFIVEDLDKNSQGYNNQPIDTRDEGGLVVVPPHKSRHWLGKFSRKRIMRVKGLPDVLKDRGIPFIDTSEVDSYPGTIRRGKRKPDTNGKTPVGFRPEITDVSERSHKYDFEVLLQLEFMGRRLENFMAAKYPMEHKSATEYQCCFCNTDLTDVRCPLVVYPATQSFYCHRCNQTGNIIDIMMCIYNKRYIAVCKKLKALR